MSDEGKGNRHSGRQGLIDLIPVRDVPPGTFGGADEVREKDCDQVVSFVESWLAGREESDPEGQGRVLARQWREGMGRDDLQAAILDQIEVVNNDRTSLMQTAAAMIPQYAWQVGERLIIRMHPEGWNRYWRNIEGALASASQRIREKMEPRCNSRQHRDIITISGTDVAGDMDCDARPIR